MMKKYFLVNSTEALIDNIIAEFDSTEEAAKVYNELPEEMKKELNVVEKEMSLTFGWRTTVKYGRVDDTIVVSLPNDARKIDVNDGKIPNIIYVYANTREDSREKAERLSKQILSSMFVIQKIDDFLWSTCDYT